MNTGAMGKNSWTTRAAHPVFEKVRQKKSDFAVALRSISLVTPKIEKEKEWLYNLANANRMIEEYDAAISNLTLAIRLDENYFQAYKDLEAIHEMMGNNTKAKRIRDRMETAAAKLIEKQHRIMCKRYHTDHGINPMWIINNSNEVHIAIASSIDEKLANTSELMISPHFTPPFHTNF